MMGGSSVANQQPHAALYVSPEFEPIKAELLPAGTDHDDALLTELPQLQTITDSLNERGETNLFSEGVDLISKPFVFQGITCNTPPDPVLDAGRDHIVQMVNDTRFQIWDKHGN